jgi:hypothetical protein
MKMRLGTLWEHELDESLLNLILRHPAGFA